MLNKSNGNMYPWVTHTWNPISGKCSHNCTYCYMNIFPQKEIHLNEKTLQDNLGSGNKIFVGSSTDMWAKNVPTEWIYEVLAKCRNYDNTYLFQSKNVYRFRPDILNKWNIPDKTMIGTTIESDRDYGISKAIPPKDRAEYFAQIEWISRMVSVEPIMDFDLEGMIKLIARIKPEFVSIGADSKNNDLPEPPAEKILKLIEKLSQFTDVRVKDNLTPLISGRI